MSARVGSMAPDHDVTSIDLQHLHDAFARAQGAPREGQRARSLSAALLMVLVVGAVLVALQVGVGLYGEGHAMDLATSAERRDHALLVNSLLAADMAGEVLSLEGPEGPCLVVREQTVLGDFDTRIYLSDGQLMRDYAVAGAELVPDRAIALMAAEDFSFSIEPCQVVLTVDGVSQNVARRGGEVTP